LPLPLDALGAPAGHVQQQTHATSSHAHPSFGPAPVLAPLTPCIALLHVELMVRQAALRVQTHRVFTFGIMEYHVKNLYPTGI